MKKAKTKTPKRVWLCVAPDGFIGGAYPSKRAALANVQEASGYDDKFIDGTMERVVGPYLLVRRRA